MNQNSPISLLKEYWGHTSFREPQEAVIEAVLADQDCFVLMPTGGGKSLCYQIPALIRPGICIVIAPLVALMKDQVQNLNQRGIKAMALTSGIKYQELDALLDNCIYGSYKFLYLSPERLKQPIVQERIRQMNVNLIAVDEAHCISQWGNDFRPAYQHISILREFHPGINVIALTASATPRVVDDVIDNLALSNASVFKKSFARPNISYQVVSTQDKLFRMVEILQRSSGASIVYVRNRKATASISKHLNAHGIESTFYHGGIPSEEKNKRLQEWLTGAVRCMVATNAFGMGIDKPDVRVVIHASLPDCIENYYQEAGRAGRDGTPSEAIILKNDADAKLVKDQFLSVLPDVSFVKKCYNKLCNYFQVPFGEGEQTTHEFRFDHFCNTYGFNPLVAFNALQILDRESIINLSQNFRRRTEVQFLVSNHHILTYLERNEDIQLAVRTLLRTYGGIFEHVTKVNLRLLSTKTSLPERKILSVLERLHSDGIISLKTMNTDAEVTFLVPREDDSTINPIAKHIEQHHKLKEEKVASMLSYVNDDQLCKSIFLSRYFGEAANDPCGICSVCKPKEKSNVNITMETIREQIIFALTEKEMGSRELVRFVQQDEKKVFKGLQQLLEEERIIITNYNKYRLHKE